MEACTEELRWRSSVVHVVRGGFCRLVNVSNRQLGKRSVQRSLSKSGDMGAFAGGFDSMNHSDT